MRVDGIGAALRRCSLLALLLWLPLSVTAQESETLEALAEKAESGDSAAQFDLGSRYLYGEGVEQSNFEALHWFRLAAEQDNHNAQYNLAVMYLNGIGVVANTEEALRWFEAAANNGDGMAQYNLGVFHANGVYGLDQDILRAWMWFTLAGSGGLQNAASNAVLLQEFLSAEQIERGQAMVRQQILRIQER